MGSALELPAPGTNKLTFVIEDHHGVQAVAVRMYSVVDVDEAL